ncbi:MAG: glycosyltransferase family 2 protein [Planctomyces sp.]|nr:glycosyltransferase family 2 protein [Planctomyces sp.]
MVVPTIDISFVVPVYNGALTIGSVVSRILQTYANSSIEIVLVNDGSADTSTIVCRHLVHQYPQQVIFIDLARNFGEHNAVLAGLAQTRGRVVAVLDDDGQNPPEEVGRMWRLLEDEQLDVVYGHYRIKQHSWFRNLGSRLNDVLATRMLKKPAHLYLSSLKVMTRFVVNEVIRYRGPFPYIDGLIFRTTRRIGQLDVDHAPRVAGQSGYTLRKLVRLWLNMFLGFSIAPLRIAVMAGLLTSVLSVLLMLAVLVDRLWLNPDVPVGIPSVLVFITFFSGVQLTVLGMVGEYVGRVFLEQNGTPQYIIRETLTGEQQGPLDSGIYAVIRSDDVVRDKGILND